MLLRNPISKTKKFFHKTLQGIKALLSGGYERLPKTPPFNPSSCDAGGDMKNHQNVRELDNFYTNFTNQWESNHNEAKKRTKKKRIMEKEPMKEENIYNGRSFMKFAKQRPEESCCLRVRETESYMLAQKLKELELIDVSNVDHVLDIEEILHYYSRLTCPVYLDIVDKFFMDMYSEFFSSTDLCRQ